MNLAELMITLELGLIYSFVAMGVYITFKVIDFQDLSCDGSFVFGACASVLAIKSGFSPMASLFVALTAGAFSGFLTAFLHLQLKIPPLLSGILVAFMLYSINLRVMGGIPNVIIEDKNSIFSLINPLTFLLVTAIGFALFGSYLLKTGFGLSLKAYGENKRLSKALGISDVLVTFFSLMGSNALIALGGALLSHHMGFSDISSGVGSIVIALASLMIGEAFFSSKGYQLIGAIIGSLLFRLFIAFAMRTEWLFLEPYDLNLLTGVLILTLMSFSKKGKVAC